MEIHRSIVEEFRKLPFSNGIDLALEQTTLEGMILIVTALMVEARPIRDHLGLSALGSEPFPVFCGEQATLVVSGTGSLKSSAATAWAMARFPDIRAAVNVGFAGAPLAISPLYRWHLIHSVRDQSSGRLYIPDILVQHGFPEANLLTCGQAVRDESGLNGLVDMEGSGFYEAARQFLSPDRIALLKWVSDHLGGKLDMDALDQPYREAMGPLAEFLHNWAPLEKARESESSPAILETVKTRLRLSQTQEKFLDKWVRGYLSRGGEESRLMEVLPEKALTAKRENNRYFEILKDVLKG
ncbi:MAG: hypothetical protein AB3N64_02400 [Puniceicoccaceae bacterium]